MKNILIVDDEPDVINYVVGAFDEDNYNFLQASNGINAFKIIQKVNIDLIITDWDMPVCNGMELINMVKSVDRFLSIPIIVFTGAMGSTDNLKIAFEKGANDFIRKPINKIELVSRVNSLIQLVEFHNQSRDFERQLALTEKKLIENQLLHSKEILSRKLIQLVKASNKINDFIAILNLVSDHCNVNGQEIIHQYKKELAIDKAENTELNFIAKFDAENPTFSTNLSQKYPDITEKERKICALLSLGLSNKEIATFFNNSESTIKTTRKLLRRKFDIDASIVLSEFLKKV